MFTASDLDPKYKYSNKAEPGDNPYKTGSPDNDMLDRTVSYEMVNFINHILNTWNWDKPKPLANHIAKNVGTKIEFLIKEKLPSNIRSRANIEAWLLKNWTAYNI